MKKFCLIVMLISCFVWGSCAEEVVPSASYTGNGYILNASLTSGGLRVALSVSVKNTGAEKVSVLIRNIALDGESTGASATLEAGKGKTAQQRFIWQKEALGATTLAQIWAEISIPGQETEQQLLTITPLGEARVKHLSISREENTVAAYDDENAGVFFARIVPPNASSGSGLQFEWYLVNKSDEPLRFVMTALAENEDSAPAVCDLIPHTVAYLPDGVPFGEIADSESPRVGYRIAGYLPGSDLPLFQTEYTLNVLSPKGIPTMQPTAAPGPVRIGTVTIRKSGDVNVREEGTTKAKKVGSAKAGASYPCYGTSDTGWYLIELENGVRGYVTNAYSTLVRN